MRYEIYVFMLDVSDGVGGDDEFIILCVSLFTSCHLTLVLLGTSPNFASASWQCTAHQAG